MGWISLGDLADLNTLALGVNKISGFCHGANICFIDVTGTVSVDVNAMDVIAVCVSETVGFDGRGRRSSVVGPESDIRAVGDVNVVRGTV